MQWSEKPSEQTALKLFKNSYKNIILEIQRNSFLVTASDCSVFSSLFLRLPAVPIKLFLLLLFVPCPPQLFPGEISLRLNDEDHKKGRNVRGERNIIRKIMHSSFVPITHIITFSSF